MTSQLADEDILIQAARAERGQHRSGASMAALLGMAVCFAAVGGLLIVVPHVVSLFPCRLRCLAAFRFRSWSRWA